MEQSLSLSTSKMLLKITYLRQPNDKMLLKRVMSCNDADTLVFAAILLRLRHL